MHFLSSKEYALFMFFNKTCDFSLKLCYKQKVKNDGLLCLFKLQIVKNEANCVCV